MRVKMAGSLQTLNFRPPFARNGVLRPWKPFIPSNRILFSGQSFVPSPNISLLRKPRSISPSIRASGSHNQVDRSDDRHARIPKSVTFTESLLNFAASNFLPLALVSGIGLGLANPTLGCLAHKYSVSKFSTFGIFLISGLVLRSEDIGAAIKAWPVGLFGLCSILLFTPFFSKLILQLQLVPQEFVTGLAIFYCMPTTLSSGVTLTQLAGGNTALALAMTVISNLLGILTAPFSLSKFIADGVGVSIPTEPLFRSLVTTLLVPLIMGKVFRDCFSGVAEYVDRKRKNLSIISAIFLSLVPWIQVSKSRSLLLMVKPAVFIVAIGVGMVVIDETWRNKNHWCGPLQSRILHLFLLAFNTLAIQSLSVVTGGKESIFAKKENSRALVIVASQKTLPVMVAVVEQLHGALGESGLLVLPCVAAHINQIIIDSFLVNFWLRRDWSSTNSKEA